MIVAILVCMIEDAKLMPKLVDGRVTLSIVKVSLYHVHNVYEIVGALYRRRYLTNWYYQGFRSFVYFFHKGLSSVSLTGSSYIHTKPVMVHPKGVELSLHIFLLNLLDPSLDVSTLGAEWSTFAVLAGTFVLSFWSPFTTVLPYKETRYPCIMLHLQPLAGNRNTVQGLGSRIVPVRLASLWSLLMLSIPTAGERAVGSSSGPWGYAKPLRTWMQLCRQMVTEYEAVAALWSLWKDTADSLDNNVCVRGVGKGRHCHMNSGFKLAVGWLFEYWYFGLYQRRFHRRALPEYCLSR